MPGGLFDILDEPGLGPDPEPFVVITVSGAPRGKANMQPRIIPANAAKGRFRPFVVMHPSTDSELYGTALRQRGVLAMRGKAMIEKGEPFAMRLFIVLPIPPSWPKRDQAAAAAGEFWATSKPDDDNVSKMLDYLNGVVWYDDSQRVRSVIWKDYGTRPGIIVEVYKLAAPGVFALRPDAA